MDAAVEAKKAPPDLPEVADLKTGMRVLDVAASNGIAVPPPPLLRRPGGAKLRADRKVCRQAPAVLLEDFLSPVTTGGANMTNMISAAFPYQKQRRRVLGHEMT
jgi:hypothetical protein